MLYKDKHRLLKVEVQSSPHLLVDTMIWSMCTDKLNQNKQEQIFTYENWTHILFIGQTNIH